MISRDEQAFAADAQSGAPRIDRRRPDSARVLHSVLFARLCLVLLVAPWVLFLALKSISVANGLSLTTFFFVLCLELAMVTVVSLAVVNSRLRDLRAYEARREHERLLFSYARDGMLLVRVGNDPGHRAAGPSFVVQAENPAAIERLSSIGQAQSYVGGDIDEVFPKWLRQKLRAEYTACVLSREVRRYEISHPDGRLAHESVATPVIDPATQAVTHVIVIMRDIGDRIRHERQMSVALKNAETANKSKSEFLASMSHELRTPLNAVLGFSETILAGIGGPLSDRQREYVGLIHQSGSHLLSIITDILDLSKIEAGQVTLQEQPVAIQEIVESSLVMVQERAGAKKLQIKTSLAPDLPMMKADPLRLKQILINLLSNAIKFTEQGSVMLSAEYRPETGFEFTVTDTGIGMTAEGMQVAMQPFGQVESAFARNHAGTGLGLPITKHLVAMHEGTVALASSPGLGTRVTLRFPPGRALLPELEKSALDPEKKERIRALIGKR